MKTQKIGDITIEQSDIEGEVILRRGRGQAILLEREEARELIPYLKEYLGIEGDKDEN